MIEPFHVSFDPLTGVLVVRGELDEWTARHVYALDLAGERIREIDCRGTVFLSAGGLTSLLDRCKSRPTPIAASPQVRRLIELCGLDHIFLMEHIADARNDEVAG